MTSSIRNSRRLPTLGNPDDRNRLAAMRGWTNYIAACLRNAGFREQGDLEERIHDIVVKLLVSPGGLFRGYDARRHGPLDFRFKPVSPTPCGTWCERSVTARGSCVPFRFKQTL